MIVLLLQYDQIVYQLIIWIIFVACHKFPGKTEELKQLFLELVDFFKQKRLKTVINKSYNLSEIIEAHHYLETGRKVGNIVIINQH